MIGVTGATGTIGSHLLRILSDAGRRVLAFTRDPGRADPLPGVEWVEADLAERGSLADRFRPVDRLFLLTGNGDGMVRLQKNAIRAAGEAGVEHVVKLSALGASGHSRSVVGLWHHTTEEALRGSGLPWTLLRPHHFMQNLLDPVVFDREEGRVHSASGEGRIPFIDTRDIASVAATVLVEGGYDGEVLTLTGPEARSYGEATEVVGRVLGRPLTYVAEDDDQAWSRLRAAGTAPWMAAAQIEIARYQRAGGPTERTTDTVERVTSRAARTLEQFAEDHREALAAGEAS